MTDVDPGQVNLGQKNLEIAQQLLQSLSLFPLLQGEGMTPQNYRALILGAIGELQNPEFKLYYRAYVLLQSQYVWKLNSSQIHSVWTESGVKTVKCASPSG